MTDDVQELPERLRDMVSGPHDRGRRWTIRHDADPEKIFQAADALERQQAEMARLKEKLKPATPTTTDYPG